MSVKSAAAARRRCEWGSSTPIMQRYHDEEWGVPVHDERRQFEFLTLEGAQAGLSWSTVLNKREAYRKAYDHFDPVKVAAYDGRKIKALLADAGIIRNRLKVHASVNNAQQFLKVQKEFGGFCKFIWGFVGGKPKVNRWRAMKDLPARSAESDALSEDMRARGFKFVGSTILYAHLQAAGLINDHLVRCFRYKEVSL